MISLEDQANAAAKHYQALRLKLGVDCLEVPVYPLRKTSNAFSNRFRALLASALVCGNHDRNSFKFVDVDPEDYT